MRILLAIVAVALLTLTGCTRSATTEIIRAGMTKAEVRAIMDRHGGRRITDIVKDNPLPTEDWYVQNRRAIRFLYDRDLVLEQITLGSPQRGWRNAHDWAQQDRTVTKQMYLE